MYKGFILKGAGTSTSAGIVLTYGDKIITGYYDGTAIVWKGDAKRTQYMSQTITVTTNSGGGIQLSKFTNYNATIDTPFYCVVASSDAVVYCVFAETSAGKPSWCIIKNPSGNVINTQVNITMFWVRVI